MAPRGATNPTALLARARPILERLGGIDVDAYSPTRSRGPVWIPSAALGAIAAGRTPAEQLASARRLVTYAPGLLAAMLRDVEALRAIVGADAEQQAPAATDERVIDLLAARRRRPREKGGAS